MALFTDGIVSTTADLADHDSGVLDVAGAEGIDLTRKLSLAQDDLAMELSALMPFTDNLSNIVVTTALRLWHAFHTLELVYRDAYNHQLNDRYAGKRDQFAKQAGWAADKLIQAGLGMVSNPLPKAYPAALTYTPGQQSGATYYVRTSWVDGRSGEGAAGEYTSLAVPDQNILSVRPVSPPAAAAGWNVFVGLSPDTISQQNTTVLLRTQPWLQQSAVSTGGRLPGDGQPTDYLRLVARILQRG